MQDPLSKFPGYSLRRAANATAAQLSAKLGELDLRQSEASVLLIVGDNPDITASALGRQLDPAAYVVHKAWVGPMVLVVLDDPDPSSRDAAFLSMWQLDGKSEPAQPVHANGGDGYRKLMKLVPYRMVPGVSLNRE